MDEKKLLSQYVKDSRLPDLETSLLVADKSLSLFKQIESIYKKSPHPGAIVALALISLDKVQENSLENIAKRSAINLSTLLKKINEIRSLLNIPCNLSFESLIEKTKLPKRFSFTAKKIHQDIISTYPNDKSLVKPSAYAACILFVAISRGFNKDLLLIELSKIIYSDPTEILFVEKIIKEFNNGEYGLKQIKNNNNEIQEEILIDNSKILNDVNKEVLESLKNDNKKKIQTKLSFMKILK